LPACTFFGHRDCPQSIQPKIAAAIERLILEYGVNTFYVGNHGSFDRMVLRSLRQTKEKHPQIDYAIVLAYLPVQSSLQSPSDATVYPNGLENVPPRFCISYRNRWMVSASDYVITYITHSFGGAAQFASFARKKGKLVWNLAETP